MRKVIFIIADIEVDRTMFSEQFYEDFAPVTKAF